MSDTGLVEYRVGELVEELNFIQKAAARFLQPSAATRLPQAIESLKQISKSRRQLSWVVPESGAIETAANTGRHQADGKGKHNLCAHISWKWQVTPQKDAVRISGLASTKIVVLRCATEHERSRVLEINCDVGVESGPGPVFHSQTKAVGEQEMRFDDSEVDVPRILMVGLAPAECIELALSELFQEEWSAHVQGLGGSYTKVWQGQRQRMCALLDAARDRVQRADRMTSHLALKTWMPEGLDFKHRAG